MSWSKIFLKKYIPYLYYLFNILPTLIGIELNVSDVIKLQDILIFFF